jgi:hypothetical protein
MTTMATQTTQRVLSVLILGGCMLAAACGGATPVATVPGGAATGRPPTSGETSRAAGGVSGGATDPRGAATSGSAATTAASGSAAKGGSSATGGSAATAGMMAIVKTMPAGGTSSGAAGSPSIGTNAGASGAANSGAGGSGSTGTFVENSGADCGSSAAAMKKNEKLPDPFAMHDGSRVTTKTAWRCRRNEIKQDIEKYEIGPKPDKAMVEASVSAGKLTVKVTTSAGSITLSSTVTVAAGSDCVAIGMNTTSSLVTGCVQVPFMHDQVVKYASDSSQLQSDPFYKVYPELWKKVGNYAAWSWGISRLVDGLILVKDQLKIDPTKIAVHGCSYAGKMALFAGAFDERIALTVAQESGGGGINSWRTSQDFTTRTGTNVEKIDNTSGAWFLPSMKQLDPYSLPHDHHELIAMIAPRAIVAMGNQDYDWLGDESGWKSINAAKEVWKAFGVEDHIGFDFTSNHTHCSAAPSQVASAKAFVDRFLKGQNANTAIVVQPQEGNLDLDFKKSIDWQTPTLQ